MDGWIGVLGLMAMLCMRVAFSFSGLVWPGSCCGLGLIGKDRSQAQLHWEPNNL